MPTAVPKRHVLFQFRWVLAGGYLLLLLISHFAQSPPEFVPVDAASSDAEGVLVLLDPLSSSAEELREVVREAIAEGHPVRMPRLANLNALSEEETSFRSLAESLSEESVPERILANGQAGAVALFLAADRPHAVSSVTLIDASGVQEFALLGERHLNIPLYWVSGLALGVIDAGIPHFGLIPDLELTRAQLGLLRQSDRRSLRPALEQIQQPVQLIETDMRELPHSRNLEHARLLPQSSLTLIPLRELSDLLLTYPVGYRVDASEIRQLEAQQDYDPRDRPRLAGGTLILTLLAIALATLVSEDVTCAITGLMIANGNLTLFQGVGACLAGILFGDSLLYLAGRYWGRPALTRFPLRWMIDPLTLRETEEWFSRHAEKAILISRCIPGTRLPAYVAAGLLGVAPKVFAFWFILAGMIWTPLFIGITILLSGQALEWIDRYHHAAPGLLICGILLYLLVTHVLLPSLNWRGRRKLLGRWRRWTRAEYWPTAVLYVPVVVYLIARRFRKENRLLDFTACNPCMPMSGIVEESKSEILDQIGLRTAVASYVLLRAEETTETHQALITRFLQDHPPAFPVVLKPDVGQRGTDVVIAFSREELENALTSTPQDWILQQYVPGEEYGVFVICPPGGEPFIFGINGKRFPVVTGDGERPLEDLILADERAVCQAPSLLRTHADRLYTIPQAGETVPLTHVGNHCLGTEFLECSELMTPELTRSMQEMVDSIPGFAFGRLDVRAPTREMFQSGQGILILELNGVSSEATNLYDSRYNYLQMVRILLNQWKWACIIGKHQRLQGKPTATVRELFHAYDRYHKRKTNQAFPQAQPLHD